MLRRFDAVESAAGTGNKASLLSELKRNGFNVPDGFVLDSETYSAIVRLNGKEEPIEAVVAGLEPNNIKSASEAIQGLFTGFAFPEAVVDEIKSRVKEGVKYAVRSSGIKEDLENFSFAGQYSTFLNVAGVPDILNAVLECYKSMYSETVLSYLVNNGLGFDHLEMAVIVQEMVASEKSGIAFTVNPLTGSDKEIVLEIAEGLGENIVSGKVVPERYRYNWFDGEYMYDQSNKLLSAGELQTIMKTMLDIQIHFGYPCDVEFAVEKGELYILQSRAITKIMYSGIKEQWSTADFKDGGVSATVCTPFMWSLYEYVWDTSLKKFFIDLRILKEDEISKLSDMFYGRPYWNMTMVKKAMSAIPGHKERDFDTEFGVKITYEGDGETTKITPGSIGRILRVALRQKSMLEKQLDNIDRYKSELLEKYHWYIDGLDVRRGEQELLDGWLHLIKNDYLQGEGTYFRQIFLNTVQQSLFKSKILKHTNLSGYFTLIGGLENISHLLPFYDMWELSRQIRKDEEAFGYWKDSPADRIARDMENNRAGLFLPEFGRFVQKYGYHSEKELDVTYPCFSEAKGALIKMIKDNILLDENFSPTHDIQKQRQAYQNQLETFKAKAGPRKFPKLLSQIERMRSMLWWREELRDVSTRFYYVIRLYTLKLADSFAGQGVIDRPEDIWFLKIADIYDFAENRKSAAELKNIIRRNRTYYNSFRNFTSENEIGAVFDREGTEKKAYTGNITGLGCNSGSVTGTARVIESLAETDRLQTNDILVTKFTDTGWTGKFAILKGIVTEYGGVLCHAAIVSREYGIPCVVCVPDAMKKIKDGSKIEINGETGEIRILKE